MAETNDSKRTVARPYHDLRTPFTVDEKGAFAEYIIQDPDIMPDLALGANIVIQDTRNGKILFIAGRIIGLRAISPFNPDRENMLYIEDETQDPSIPLQDLTGHHTHQPMVIRVQIDREMDNISDDLLRQFSSYPVQRPPSALSRLFFPYLIPDVNSTDIAPTLQEILDIRGQGLSLGKIGFGNRPYESNNKFLDYKWDIDNLDNKHTFVVGESGSGKTVFLKNLAYEIRKHDKKNRIILTDVQGDISQLLLFDITDKLEPKGWTKKVEYENYQQIESHLGPYQIVIPARKEGNTENIIALKKLAQNKGIKVSEIGLRLQDLFAPSEVEYLYRISSEQAAMLLDEEAEILRTKNQSVTVANLRGVIDQILGRNQGQNLISSGGTSYLRTTFYAAKRALKSLEEYFDFHQQSMQNQNNPLDSFNFDGTTILFLDELDQDEKVMWEMQLVKWLYTNKKENWKAFVFFDEAHQIIPAQPSGAGAKGTFERLRTNFERLAREGRKFGINLVLSTQNPKDLHPIVPEQCPTRIVMKINPRNAPYAFLDAELAMIANRFSHGQFWIQSPFNGTPNWVRVHSVTPPLPHEPMVNFWDKVRNAAIKQK